MSDEAIDEASRLVDVQTHFGQPVAVNAIPDPGAAAVTDDEDLHLVVLLIEKEVLVAIAETETEAVTVTVGANQKYSITVEGRRYF